MEGGMGRGGALHSSQVCPLLSLASYGPRVSHRGYTPLYSEKSWGPRSSLLTSNSISDRESEWKGLGNLEMKKNITSFSSLTSNQKLAFPPLVEFEDKLQYSQCSWICHQEKPSLFLLLSPLPSQRIIFTQHCFKITILIRPAPSSRYLVR